jgi:hypothetical protein
MDEMNYLIDLNRGRGLGVIVSHYYTHGKFEVETDEEYKLQYPNQ